MVYKEFQEAVDSRQRFRKVEHWEIADARRVELKERDVYIDDKALTWRGNHQTHGHVNT